ncbi:MAG TPA: amidase [Caldithrix abyssi]|uniref:Amidase n=1 Tax=Caldithrix abyssi TaxID=187145 RepID=A0A7V4WU77_CALAY|nr:amidase [Caldithrix abyssi]
MKKYIIILLVALGAFIAGVVLSPYLKSENINRQTIDEAARLIGLEFTDSEKDTMLADLQERLEKFKGLRAVELDNAVPPAIQFNPLPVGFEAPKKEGAVRFTSFSKVTLPQNRDDLAWYSIGQLAALIRSRQITSEELTRFFIERLKKYDPKLHCVIALTEERALKMARKADKEIAAGKYRGLLHGIPYGVKDLLSVKGYKTTWGAAPFKDQVFDSDATVVKKLDEAGAVLVAKLSMGALAWGDVWFGGKTRNPWNMEQGSSGSSAGSASAVSAGLLPFALGTETWGSIVSPSTVCGVTGLRPTYGRVSRTGAMALSWTMDKIGTICRTAEDCAIVLNAIYGPDSLDQTVYDFPFNYDSQTDVRQFKIGYLKSDFESDYAFKKNDSLALAKLRDLGLNLVAMELPDINVSDLSFILSAEAAAAFDQLTRSGRDDLLVRQVRNAWPNVFRHSRFIPAVEYINANRVRYKLIQAMAKLMDTVDLYLAPSWQGKNLLLTNLSGHPCVVLPNGFSEEGTPTSFTINGRLFEEGTIVAVARFFQQHTDFHLKHPPLDKK